MGVVRPVEHSISDGLDLGLESLDDLTSNGRTTQT
jgi:hypothetical protein